MTRAHWVGLLSFGLGLLFLYLLSIVFRVAPSEQIKTYPNTGEEKPVAPVSSIEEVSVRQAFWELDPGDLIEDPKNPRLLRHYGTDRRTAKEDLQMVAAVLQRFWLRFKDPDLLRVGSNEEIMESLIGNNPGAVSFVSKENDFLDASGRLLDRWGEPLFFHAQSMTHIDIRSSGPDGKRFTSDDIVVRAGTSGASSSR